VSKSLLDTDILSEILKGINPTVASNAAAYKQIGNHFTIACMEMVSLPTFSLPLFLEPL
jgi:hypothetical protein